MKSRALVLGVTAVAFAVGVILWFSLSQTKEPARGEASSAAPAQSIRPGQHPTFGNMMARVTVVEWLDPECEGCRAMHPLFKKIVADYGPRVHFVIRYMPFHGNSLYAASALEEARELGKFSEALDILFEKQPEWASHRSPRPDLIPTYLAGVGIPAERLQPAFVIQKHGSKIKRDEEDGLKAGVRGTPTFFVNGRQLAELGEKPLRDAIDKALSDSR